MGIMVSLCCMKPDAADIYLKYVNVPWGFPESSGCHTRCL